jgi:hypothetical protein
MQLRFETEHRALKIWPVDQVNSTHRGISRVWFRVRTGRARGVSCWLFAALAGVPTMAAAEADKLLPGEQVALASLQIAKPVNPVSRKPRRAPAARPVTLVIVGDTGFSAEGQRADQKLGRRSSGASLPFARMTRDIAGLINGDVNFANLETVVTDNNRIAPVAKRFRFKTHPNGVDHLTRVGFNLFSLANNHAVDFGRQGLADTQRHMARLARTRDFAFAGLGATREAALAPALFEARQHRLAMSAIGIGATSSKTFWPDGSRVGQLPYTRETLAAIAERLVQPDADYRVLSVHAGLERRVRPTSEDVVRLRDVAIGQHGVDLVVTHHAHVVQGIQRVGDGFVFYGLGNFMHPGMSNMAGMGFCRDYGLVAKLHLLPKTVPLGGQGGRLEVAAIEAFAITDMHRAPRLLPPKAGSQRIAVLNGLARGLDTPKADARGVRFQVRKDGTGLHCTERGAELPGAIGAACKSRVQVASIDGSHGLKAFPYANCGAIVARPARVSRNERVRGRSAQQDRARQGGRAAWARRVFSSR